MNLQLSGLERYQSHQRMGQLDTTHRSQQTGRNDHEGTTELNDDAVSISDDATVMEWIAHQAPSLSEPSANSAASLGRLSDQLLRFDLITVPEAGQLMSLAENNSENPEDSPLFSRIGQQLENSEGYQQTQQWKKLGRLVSNLAAAQNRPGY